MSREVTTETTCDLCGAKSTKQQWVHELPGINFGDTSMIGMSFSGPPSKDYCDACVEYVAAAVKVAKEDRRG